MKFPNQRESIYPISSHYYITFIDFSPINRKFEKTLKKNGVGENPDPIPLNLSSENKLRCG